MSSNDIESIKTPIFGNKYILKWESDRALKEKLMRQANLDVPKTISSSKEIDRLVIAKRHGAAGGKGYFLTTNEKDYKKKRDKLIKQGVIKGDSDLYLQEYVSGVLAYLQYFYSPLKEEIEFFGIDPDSNVIQITQAGALGSSTTKLSGSSITFDKGVTTMSKDQQVSGWLRVSGAGAVVAASQNLTPANDLTVSRVSAGLYTIGFTIAPVTTDFVGMATCANTSSRRSISCENYTATTFQVRIYSNSTGSNEDEPFQVVVFGGR